MTAGEFYDPFFVDELDYSTPSEVEPLGGTVVGERILMPGRALAVAVAMTGLLLFGPSTSGSRMSQDQPIIFSHVQVGQTRPPLIYQQPLSALTQQRAARAARLFVTAPLTEAERRGGPDYGL